MLDVSETELVDDLDENDEVEVDNEDERELHIASDVNLTSTQVRALQSEETDPDNDLELALLPDDVRRARREAMKPDISWMDDAIDWDAKTSSGIEFILKKGDYVVIERTALSLPNFGWLDTRVYRLTESPRPNGDLILYDPVRQQQSFSNWKVGIINDFQYKIPPRGRNPETILESGGRPRRVRKLQPAAPPPDPTQPKRGRGRPKGSKNRSKEEILAEKKLRAEESAAKRNLRDKRKRAYINIVK